jgi:hypothetical protein
MALHSKYTKNSRQNTQSLTLFHLCGGFAPRRDNLTEALTQGTDHITSVPQHSLLNQDVPLAHGTLVNGSDSDQSDREPLGEQGFEAALPRSQKVCSVGGTLLFAD